MSCALCGKTNGFYPTHSPVCWPCRQKGLPENHSPVRGRDFMTPVRWQDYGTKAHPPCPPEHKALVKAAKDWIQWAIGQCPCQGGVGPWKDDPDGASASWGSMVREYERLGGFV